MDPTIYTLGDPMIVREALFALAAIFNENAWQNDANTFGLGGNLLAAALIGLMGIVIAGINSQTLRLDFLLTAFILFAVGFAVKTNVNVEDLQTGDTAVVADVPIAVAYVASLASGAAADLTTTLSAALQRPGSETSTLDATGFLNPLKVLYGLRSMNLRDLDPTLNETLLAYYRYCIGKTLEQPGSPFSQGAYMSAPDPMAYILNPANVQNWTTVEYTEAAPEGVAAGCHDTALQIEVRMAALTGGADDRIDQWAGRKFGTDAYNVGYGLTDVQDAIDILFRGGMDAQNFMANQMLANLHNAGEAWRIAEYGSDRSMYVATLTSAMEAQRVEVAAQGSIFLQMMFPLMGFFQFLFFALPPLIVLLMIAAPQAAPKILGFYLLFGVWAYSWLPVAAVINHYMQIAIQNDLQFAEPGLIGSGYTAIIGFNSLYNVIGTKLVIGANALASVPVIVGALLTATPFAISNLAGRIGGGAKVDTSTSAPSLMSNGPVMQRAALASASVGSVVSGGGSVLAPSSFQRSAYGGVNWGSTLGKSVEAAETRASNARAQQSAASQRVFETVSSVMTSSEIESGQKRRLEASMQQSLGTAYKDSVDAETRKRLSGSQAQAVQAAFGLAAFGTSAGMSTQSTSSFTTDQMNAYQQMLAKTNDLRASVGESLVNTGELETEVGESLKKDVRNAQTAGKTAETSEEYANTARETMKRGQQLGMSGNVDLTDLASHAYMRDGNAWQSLRGIVAGAGGASMLGEMDANANRIFAETAPMGIDGKRDKIMDNVDRIAASMQALDQIAARDPVAAQAYMQALRQVGGISVPLEAGELGQAATRANDADAAVAVGAEFRRGVEEQIGATGDAIDSAAAEVNAIGAGIAGDARQREDLQAQAGAWMSQAKEAFEKDEYGVRAAAANVDAAIEGAKREQSGAMTSKVVDWLRPGSGSDAEARAQLDAVPAGREREAVVAGARAVAALGGAMRAQGDVTADPEKMYSDFVKMGWSPKAAAEAAYASAGVRTLGGSEALAAGSGISAATTLGAAGGQAALAARGAEGAARWMGLASRFGGPIAGAVAVGAGVALVSAADKKDATAIDQQMRTGLMGAARSEMGETRFKEFEGYLKEMGGAQNAEQLANHLAAFETGTSEVTGKIGAYPSIGGDAGQRVEGWDRRIRGTD